jgi:hypothetical protein
MKTSTIKREDKLTQQVIKNHVWRSGWRSRHASGVKKKKKQKQRGIRSSVLCFDKRKQKQWWAVVA